MRIGILAVMFAASFSLTALAEEATNHPLLRIENGMHVGLIVPISIDAKEQYAVTGSDDKTIRVWEVKTGTLVRVFRPPIGEGKDGQIWAVAISPDGNAVAAGGLTGCSTKAGCSTSLYIFDRVSGNLVRRINGLSSIVKRLMYSPDGRFLAATSAKGLRVYRTSNYTLLAEDNNYDGETYAMDFDRSGRLAVGSEDRSVRLYDKDFRRIGLESTRVGPDEDLGMVNDLRFSPDGTKIALALTGSCCILILESNGLKRVDLGPQSSIQGGVPVDKKGNEWASWVSALAWSSDGRRLFAASADLRRFHPEQHFEVRHALNAALRGEKYPKKPTPTSESDKLGGQLHIWEWNTDHPKTVKLDVEGIENLYILKGERLLFVSNAPSFGVLNFEGRPLMIREVKRPHMIEATYFGFLQLRTSLRINKDGSTIEFPYLRGESTKRFNFAIHSRRLSLESMPNEHLAEPMIQDFDVSWDAGDSSWKNQIRIEGRKSILPSVEGEKAVGLALARDGGEILVATEHRLRCHSRKGRLLWETMVPDNSIAVNISGDNQLAVAAFETGVIRWYRMRDGQELLALFVDVPTQRWILWTPKGYFDASRGADTLIGWHVNQGADKAANFFPASRFFEQLYRPDIIAEMLRNNETEKEVVSRLKETERINVPRGFKLPPKVVILSPTHGKDSNERDVTTQVDQKEMEVVIQAEDQGGGVDGIRLFQNEKVVGEDSRGVAVVGDQNSSKSFTKSFRVQLIEGKNVFRAVAFSRDRIESHPVETTVLLQSKGAKTSLHLVLIGINEYRNSSFNLRYALPDAYGIRDSFSKGNTKLFEQVKLYELYDKAATKSGILEQLKQIESSNPEDVVLVYFAGHGESVGDTWYFITHEITTPERSEALKAQALSSTELKQWIPKVKAQKILVLMDSCKSGAAMAAFGGRSIADRTTLAQLARATGTHIVAASTSQQEATEAQEVGHGLFTQALLQGLKGGADGGTDKDGVITVRELLAYVEGQLPKLTAKYHGREQFPVADSRGMDFPLAIVP